MRKVQYTEMLEVCGEDHGKGGENYLAIFLKGLKIFVNGSAQGLRCAAETLRAVAEKSRLNVPAHAPAGWV